MSREVGPVVRVVLVDGDEVARAGMARVLGRARGIVVLGSAGSGRDALRCVLDLRPDVVLLADRLRDLAGPALCRAILGFAPGTSIAVMSARPSGDAIAAYLGAGATGFIAGDARERDLATMIHAVAEGIAVFSPSVVARVARTIATADRRALDARAVRVLSMVSRGLSTRLIAERLGVSEGTVKNVLRAAMRTLGARRRSQVVATAIARGLIDRPDDARGRVRAPGDRGGEGRPEDLSVTVEVVDHRAVVRQGLAAILARIPGARVVAHATPGPAAVAMLLDRRPDVLLVDIRLPPGQVVHLCRSIAEHQLPTRALVLGLRVRRDATLPLMAGARACLIGETTVETLRHALRAIASGSPAAGETLVDWTTLAPVAGGLRPIELRVLELLSQGLTNNEIARHLDLSAHSVKRYLALVFERLGVHTRSEAVAAAMRAALLDGGHGGPDPRTVRTLALDRMGIVARDLPAYGRNGLVREPVG